MGMLCGGSCELVLIVVSLFAGCAAIEQQVQHPVLLQQVHNALDAGGGRVYQQRQRTAGQGGGNALQQLGQGYIVHGKQVEAFSQLRSGKAGHLGWGVGLNGACHGQLRLAGLGIQEGNGHIAVLILPFHQQMNAILGGKTRQVGLKGESGRQRDALRQAGYASGLQSAVQDTFTGLVDNVQLEGMLAAGLAGVAGGDGIAIGCGRQGQAPGRNGVLLRAGEKRGFSRPPGFCGTLDGYSYAAGGYKGFHPLRQLLQGLGNRLIVAGLQSQGLNPILKGAVRGGNLGHFGSQGPHLLAGNGALAFLGQHDPPPRAGHGIQCAGVNIGRGQQCDAL